MLRLANSTSRQTYRSIVPTLCACSSLVSAPTLGPSTVAATASGSNYCGSRYYTNKVTSHARAPPLCSNTRRPRCSSSSFLFYSLHNNPNSNNFPRKTLPIAQKMPLITIKATIKDSLTKHEVFPDVLEEFTPSGLITVSYGNNLEVALGNTLKPSETQELPDLHITFNAEGAATPTILSAGAPESANSEPTFTLVMTDPDAPSRTDKSFSEYLHYLVTGLRLKSPSAEDPTADIASRLEVEKGNTLVPYMGPGPPPKTGKHRYVFVLLRETKGSPQKFDGERARWGTEINGYGLKEYAEKNGLVPVAINFYYAQNDVQ